MTELNDDIDIYADGMEPQVFEYKLYYIRMPHALDRKTGDTITCYISVDNYKYCELMDWYYFGLRDPHKPFSSSDEDRQLMAAEREVWDWLTEWELVELKPIGPEDSEFFATDKLIGANNG